MSAFPMQPAELPVPLFDERAEKYLLGVAVHHGFERVSHLGITPFEFGDPERQAAWMAAETLFTEGKNDSVTFIARKVGKSVPDVSALCVNLEDCGTVYEPSLLDYSRSLRASYIERRTAGIGKQLLDRELSIEDAAKALAELSSTSSGLPEIQDAADLIANPRELPPELIEGVLHKGSKMVLGGGSKSFKTWSLLDMAVSVAAGVDWWGFPTTAGRVLYLNFEIADEFFTGRLQEVEKAKCVTLRRGQLDVMNLRGYAADADEILPQITAKMSSKSYSLAILDPLYKLLGARDENASRDMAQLMNAIERLAVQTGAAVAFGSHFAKGNASGKESMDRISGSGVFARDPDSILTMTRHEQDDAFTVELTLRNHAPAEPFVVRRLHPLMVRDGKLDPAKLKQVGGRRQETSADEVLNLLGEDALTFTEWSRKATEALLISVPTFKRRVRELREAGSVRTSPLHDGKYVRAHKGSEGVRTQLSPSGEGRVITPLGYDPDPNPISSNGKGGAR